jgi:hypothetical protein
MDQLITHSDDHKIFDYLASQKNPFIRGWVRLFLDNVKVDEGSNLVVGRGREFTAQRLFNVRMTDAGSNRTDWRGWTLTSFGVGSGGASITGGNPVISDVTLNDSRLFTAISLNSSYATESGSSTTGVVKPISNGGSVVLMDGGYTPGTHFSKVKCTCVVAAGEPTSLVPGSSVQISEAALYATSGSSNVIFSHICFAPKWKELESVLTIEWYIIC